jgi:hypothetical protein
MSITKSLRFDGFWVVVTYVINAEEGMWYRKQTIIYDK